MVLMYIEILLTTAKLQICSKFGPILSDCQCQLSCHYLEFTIISNTKLISSRFSCFLSVLKPIFNNFETAIDRPRDGTDIRFIVP
jgi:hypothetical protein